LDAVEGLYPDREKHEFFFDVIPSTGIPLEVNGRMQINMQLTNVSEIKPAAGLRPILFPVLWFQDGVPEMDEGTQANLRMSVNLPKTMKITTLSLSFVLGIALFIGGITMLVKLLCCDVSDEELKAKKQNNRNNLQGHSNPGMEKD